MRIAFTGKGGSGKSTLAALFIGYLRSTNARVLAVDADVNIHLAPLLGVAATPSAALSHPDNSAAIRRHLRGSNVRVPSPEHFVPTTPPGPGSGRVTLEPSDAVLSSHATALDGRTHVMHVGTYERDDIGAGCYHGHLAILENLLSHLEVRTDDWVVCDMVAGTDAFANSLHAQFDAIVVVVEPTPESVSVARRYGELATAAGVGDLVVMVANKVADDADLEYLRQTLAIEPLAVVGLQTGLRRARQAGACPAVTDLDSAAPLQVIAGHVRARPMSPERRAGLLRALHLKLATQAWVRNTYGDVTGQLEPATA